MELVREFAEDTTFHGIKDFRRIRSRWALAIWTVIVVTCVGVMLLEMVMIVKQYRDNPTATQVTPLFLDSYPYPRILFCPNEWINETKVAELNISKPLLTYALSLLQDLVLSEHERQNFTASSHDLDELDGELRAFLKRHKFKTYVMFYGLIANDPPLVAHCDKCTYYRKHITASGVCMQLRLNPASSAFLIQSPPSFLYREPEPDSHNAHLVPEYSGLYTADALYVSYLPQNEFFLFDPILLNRNFSYILRIKPTLYQRLNKPPDKSCMTPEIYKITNHSQLMCYAKCDEGHKNQCRGCFYLGHNEGIIGNGSVPADFDLPLCSTIVTDQEGQCVSGGPEYEACVSSCSPLCHEWVYETTLIPVSQRKLLSSDHEHDISVAFSYQVRYGETLIKEVSTYSWDSFLSNVGGQLGLWMGASVVSVLQLIHFLIMLLYEKALKSGEEDSSPMGTGHSSTHNGHPTQNGLHHVEHQHHRNGDAQMTERPVYFVKNVFSNYVHRHTSIDLNLNGLNGVHQQNGTANGVSKRRTSWNK